MVCIHIHITAILKGWSAYGGRDLLVFWSKTLWYKWESFLWLQWSLEILCFSFSKLNLFIKEQKLFHSGFGRITLLEDSTSASQLWASLAGAVCGLHKSIPCPWRKWELLGSGCSVHWCLHASIWVSQAWHWQRDIVHSPFVTQAEMQ